MFRRILFAWLVVASPLTAQPSDTTAISTAPLFVRKDAYYAAGFVVATAAAAPLDRYFAERLQRPWAQENRFLARTADILRWTGAPGVYFIGASLYGAGRLFGNERMADLGLHGTEALVVGHLTGFVLDNRIDDWLLAGSLSRGDNGAVVFRMSILPGAMSPTRR